MMFKNKNIGHLHKKCYEHAFSSSFLVEKYLYVLIFLWPFEKGCPLVCPIFIVNINELVHTTAPWTQHAYKHFKCTQELSNSHYPWIYEKIYFCKILQIIVFWLQWPQTYFKVCYIDWTQVCFREHWFGEQLINILDIVLHLSICLMHFSKKHLAFYLCIPT